MDIDGSEFPSFDEYTGYKYSSLDKYIKTQNGKKGLREIVKILPGAIDLGSLSESDIAKMRNWMERDRFGEFIVWQREKKEFDK